MFSFAWYLSLLDFYHLHCFMREGRQAILHDLRIFNIAENYTRVMLLPSTDPPKAAQMTQKHLTNTVTSEIGMLYEFTNLS
jgi:hypothetical protein